MVTLASDNPSNAMKRKRQQSLHAFLGIKDYRVPFVFHLDWENKMATFHNERPLGALWDAEFLWKEQNREMLLTSTVDTTKKLILDESARYSPAMIPMLKSHLQKCTRRGLYEKAVQTAKHLINLDFNIFIRRWTIILLEDAMLHVNYPVLVWLMVAASKGYEPNMEIISWILGHVQATSSYPVKLEYNICKTSKLEIASEFISTLPTDSKSLIYALKLRQAYGGMKVDAEMIESVASTLLESLDSKRMFAKKLSQHFSFNVSPIDYKSVKDLDLDQWELAAIDFHVSNIIDQWWDVLDHSDTLLVDKECLKECLWECSGSVNHRTSTVPSRFAKFWCKYSIKVASIAKKILLKKMENKLR